MKLYWIPPVNGQRLKSAVVLMLFGVLLSGCATTPPEVDRSSWTLESLPWERVPERYKALVSYASTTFALELGKALLEYPDIKTLRRREDLLRISNIQDPRQKVAEVNLLVNQIITYKPDLTTLPATYLDAEKNIGPDVWGEYRMAIDEGGDCEDIVLMKALALISLGILPGENTKGYLLLGATRYNGKPEGHAVMLLEMDGEQLVLDNLFDEVQTVAESKRLFTPFFAFGGGHTYHRVK